MAGGVNLGLDDSHAHVQRSGAYHYHGIPTRLVRRLARANTLVLVGYAADGFPIYALLGHDNPEDSASPVRRLRSSYRIRSGRRPAGRSGPGGRFDGTFVQDYEYVEESGDLDECNGRIGVTPEYPSGTYHYVLTDTYPFIPRMYLGQPDNTFLRHRRRSGGDPGLPPGRPSFRRPPPLGRRVPPLR